MRNSFRPASDSLLARWFARGKGHPDAFTCGLRVLAGDLAGESARWRYCYAAVDPYQPAGVVTLRRDGRDLPLRLLGEPPGRPTAAGAAERPGHRVLRAVETGSGAAIELSVPLEDVARFGVED